MKPTEVVLLTGYLRAHFPSQPVDEFTTEALEELLEPFPAADARRAILNLADRGDKWCSPTDVRNEVRRLRNKRVSDYGPIEPPAGLDPDDVRGYQRWLGNMHKGIADGTILAPPEIDMGDHDVIRELGQVGREVPES